MASISIPMCLQVSGLLGFLLRRSGFPLEIQAPQGGWVCRAHATSTGDSSGTRSAVLYFTPSCKIQALPVLSSPGKQLYTGHV